MRNTIELVVTDYTTEHQMMWEVGRVIGGSIDEIVFIGLTDQDMKLLRGKVHYWNRKGYREIKTRWDYQRQEFRVFAMDTPSNPIPVRVNRS